MKYMGSKNRFAKELLPIVLKDRTPGQYYIEPFVGGANLIDKVDGPRIGYDVNECLIACLDELSKGWEPPREISREFYSECRTKYNNDSYSYEEKHIIGYVGINGSYGGRWFDGGFAGKSTTKSGLVRDYPLEAYKNVMKQVEGLQGVKFIASDFIYIENIDLPPKSIIYCDPPYRGTKEYKYIKGKKILFTQKVFWDWVRERVFDGHKVFVSEYQAPKDFKYVWEKKAKSSLSANGKIGGNKNSTEKLFVYCG